MLLTSCAITAQMDIIREIVGSPPGRITVNRTASAEPFQWPSFLNAKHFTFTRFRPEDVDGILPVLADIENQRLFQQTYRMNPNQARSTILGDDNNSETILYTILSPRCPAGQALIRIQHDTTSGTLDQVLFAPAQGRQLLIFAISQVIAAIAFEELHCERFELRTRSLGSGDVVGERYGFSLTSILRRQVFVPEESAESDLFRVEAWQWPMMKEAARAWLETVA
jgi:hypothetical protein